MPAQDLLNTINESFSTLSKSSPSTIIDGITIERIGAWTSRGDASLKISAESPEGQIKIQALVELLSKEPYDLKESGTFKSNDYTYNVSQKSSMFSSPGSTLSITPSGLIKINDAIIALISGDRKKVKPSSRSATDSSVYSTKFHMKAGGVSKRSATSKLESATISFSPWLDNYIEENELDDCISECSCCEAYDSSKPDNGRVKLTNDIVKLAEGKKDITLMVIGSGSMKPTLSTCEQLMRKGHNVNLILIEPRFVHDDNPFPKGSQYYSMLAGGYDEHKAKISDEQMREFDKVTMEMSRYIGKTCKIIGTFPTLSSYYVHAQAAKSGISASRLAKQFIHKYDSDKRYKIYSNVGDYFGKEGDFKSSISDSIEGGRFTIDPMSSPTCPDIICASDMGPYGAAGKALTEGCRDLAEYIVEDIYEYKPSSAISWKKDDPYENPKTDLDYVVRNSKKQLDDTVCMDDSYLMKSAMAVS